jgi:hypothetical protein
MALGVGTLLLTAGAAAIGYYSYRSAMSEAREAYNRVAAATDAPPGRFDPKQITRLPKIAQRYFRHAIAPGTPLFSAVELEMEGTFLLGDKSKYQTYAMSARQALRSPDQFVWMPRMRSGVLTITGSDGHVQSEAWTRFWLLGLVPVAQDRSSPDLVRSARFRAVVESALWLPASLLPENGVEWQQLGADRARVTFHRVSPLIELELTLDKAGAVREAVGQRWSNANPERTFRLQPFGATMSEYRTFQGLTIPTRISAGNHFGTPDYLPFFQAHLTDASYR